MQLSPGWHPLHSPSLQIWRLELLSDHSFVVHTLLVTGPRLPPCDVTPTAHCHPNQALITFAYFCCPWVDGSSGLWALLNHKQLLLVTPQNPRSGCILHQSFWQRRKKRKLKKKKVSRNCEWREKREGRYHKTGVTQCPCNNSVFLKS